MQNLKTLVDLLKSKAKKTSEDKDLIEFDNKIEDSRGFIQSVSDLEMKSASIIFTKKKSMEGKSLS